MHFNLPFNPKNSGVFLLSCIVMMFLFSPIPTLATSYNYFADGTNFDIVGMFDCSADTVDLCTELNIKDWMFTQVGGNNNDGLTFAGPSLTLSQFNGSTGRLLLSGLTEPREINVGSTDIDTARTVGILPVTLRDSTRLEGVSITPKETEPIPVPTTMWLFGANLLGLAVYQWHQRRQEKFQTA